MTFNILVVLFLCVLTYYSSANNRARSDPGVAFSCAMAPLGDVILLPTLFCALSRRPN